MNEHRNLGRPINKILILKWSALGDIAMATAVMEDIRQAFPDSQIDLNTMPKFSHLLVEDDRFENIFAVELREKGAKFTNALSWLNRVRSSKYDLIIDLQSNDRSRLMLGLLKISNFRSPLLLGHHKGFPYDYAPPPIRQKPQGIVGLQRMLGEIGVKTKTNLPTIKYRKERKIALEKSKSLHHLFKDDFLILVPGSQAGGFLKRWGFKKYAELANTLWHKHHLRSCLVGGPDDTKECELVHAHAPEATLNLCGKTEILDLIPIGSRAKAIVANDTGPAHVLATCGKPMISICGPTDPIRVKPLGDKVQTIQADVECKSCYLKECPNQHICMESVSVGEVLELVSRCIALKP